MAKRNAPPIPESLQDAKLPTGIFSASQYSAFKKCGEAYRRRYVLGEKIPPSALMFRGTVIHAGAEAAHLHLLETKQRPPLEQIKAVISDSFDSEKDTVEVWDDTTPGEVKDASLKSYAVYHEKALPTLNPVAVEKHFAVRIGDVPVQGFIDLVHHEKVASISDVEDPGKAIVVDLKTTSTSWSQSDLNVDPQFTMYAMVERTPFVRVENLVQLKAGPKRVSLDATRSMADYRVLTEDLAETADLIKKGVFPKAPIDSWACSARWCGYWSSCRGRKL